jgi:dihydropteroate synthase type 2
MTFKIPEIVGIVNITEDSFSDGGHFLRPEDAIRQARALADGGADIIELGPASSNPDSTPVSAEAEIDRLRPVLKAVLAMGLPVSIDSFQTETQRFAIDQGVALLNDTRGFADESFYPELARARCRLVIMHAVQSSGRASRVASDVGTILERIETFFEARLAALERARVARERMILDPGMGFFLGSSNELSLVVLRNLARMKARFGLPILVSVSRKSFLQRLVKRPAAGTGPATLAAELFAAEQGIDYIRTHEAGPLREALIVQSRLRSDQA